MGFTSLGAANAVSPVHGQPLQLCGCVHVTHCLDPPRFYISASVYDYCVSGVIHKFKSRLHKCKALLVFKTLLAFKDKSYLLFVGNSIK